jgi:hypothetical protein
MGFTPLDGIAMCTRSGAIDPGILLHLLRHGTDLNSLEQTLNKRSGSLRPFRTRRRGHPQMKNYGEVTSGVTETINRFVAVQD